MPYKDLAKRKEKAKEYSARHYAANSTAQKVRTKASRKAGKEKWNEFKATLMCTQCGISHPAVIDFHHPPGTKEYSVHKLAQNGRYKKAYTEAEKCIVLCSNCHRLHHHNERLAKKMGAEAPILSGIVPN
jgi:hypothetical protein